jgi:hypothetical protein
MDIIAKLLRSWQLNTSQSFAVKEDGEYETAL